MNAQPCPYCGGTNTSRIETGLDANWHCTPCNSLFHGTTTEYAQWELRRSVHQTDFEEKT